MRMCNNRECDNDFTPYNNRQNYCSDACKSREQYLSRKDRGYYDSLQVKYNRICKSRECEKEFTTTSKIHIFCCDDCKRIERNHRKKEQYHAPKQWIVAKCQSRYCNIEFKTNRPTQTFCSVKCRRAEKNAKNRDKINPNRQVYVNHEAILNTKQVRQKRFEIKKMSAKWLQDLWDAKKEMECA